MLQLADICGGPAIPTGTGKHALDVEKGRGDAQGLVEREGVGKGIYERVGEGE